jgi:hypothetical protein
VIAPFESYREVTRRYGPGFACHLEAHAPFDLSGGDWRLIGLDCRERVERELCPDPILDYRPTRKRHQPSMRSTAATSQRPGTVALASTDPLKRIPPSEYVEAFTREAVPTSGKIICPLHDERTPSFHVYPDHWWCFGCNNGGGVYELASRITGLSTHGPDFLELRRWIAASLLAGGVHV